MTTLHSTRAVFAILLIVHVAHAEVPGVDEADYPATIAELAPEPIPAEQNAAVHLERIAPDLEAFGKAYGAYIISPEGESFENRIAKGKPPTAEQLASVRKILDDHAVIFEALEKAAACDAYASQLDFTLPANQFIQQVLDRTTDIRTLARGVHWRITLLLAEGRRNDAVRLGTQMLRMARLYEDEPTLVNYLVSVAVRGVAIDALNRAMRSGPINQVVRSNLLSELAFHEVPSLKKALSTERAYAFEHIADQLQGIAQAPGFAGQFPPQLLQWQNGELSMIEKALQSADKPWHEIRAEWEPAALPQATVAPSLIAAFKTEARRLALVRCLRILIALDEYQKRNGREATEIDQLELPAEVIVDPFSGNSLQLKSTEEGWVIYSVFSNGVDDGGDFHDQKDHGLAPPDYQHRQSP